MALLDVTATLEAIRSKVLASGYADATLSDPKSPPLVTASQAHAAIFMDSAEVRELTVGNGVADSSDTIELHTVNVDVYGYFLDEPGHESEVWLVTAANTLANQLASDADLGGAIRHIDVGGIYGASMGIRFAYRELGGRLFRVAEINLPLVVDGNWNVTL